MKEGLRKHTINNQLDISFHGGGKRLRYFTLLSYKNDYGILNETYAKYSDRYTAQMRKYELGLRMNIERRYHTDDSGTIQYVRTTPRTKRPNTSEYDLFAGAFQHTIRCFPHADVLMDIGGVIMY